MHRIKITPLIRFLLVFCIIVAGTAVKPQAVEAAVKPGWIVSCTYSHSLSDDPIVFPRLAGASHLHDFAGAITTDAFSTFNTLVAGGTTCAMPGDTSAYWVPALYEDGVRILPEARSGNTAILLSQDRRSCRNDSTALSPRSKDYHWQRGGKVPSGKPWTRHRYCLQMWARRGRYSSPAPPTQCDSGIMVMSLRFPNCWDGVNLDSADHRSHMAYPVSSRCPASHPVESPETRVVFPVQRRNRTNRYNTLIFRTLLHGTSGFLQCVGPGYSADTGHKMHQCRDRLRHKSFRTPWLLCGKRGLQRRSQEGYHGLPSIQQHLVHLWRRFLRLWHKR